MIKNKLTIERVKILAFISCGGITLLLCFFALGSIFSYHTKGERIKRNQSYLSRLNKDLGNVEKFVSDYKKERKEFQAVLFEKEDIASFLDMVSQFAKKTNIKVVDIKTKRFEKVKPLEKEKKKEKKRKEERKLSSAKKVKKAFVRKSKKQALLLFMPVEGKIEGNYTSIADFLFFLESYKQLVSLTDVEIKVKKYPVLACTFCLRIYSLEERMVEDRK